jgi:hypothetical protein
MKRPELVSNKPDSEQDEKEEERPSSFPVFDRLRRERIEQDTEKPAVPDTRSP